MGLDMYLYGEDYESIMIDESIVKTIDKLNEKYPFVWVGDNSLRLDFDFDRVYYKPKEFSKEHEWHDYLDWEWMNIIEPQWKLYYKELNESNNMFNYLRDMECENRINLILNNKKK